MKQVAEEIRTQWPSVEGIAIVQRVGKLYPQTPTVLIACTAAHRDTGVFERRVTALTAERNRSHLEKRSRPNGEFWVEGEYIPKAGEN